MSAVIFNKYIVSKNRWLIKGNNVSNWAKPAGCETGIKIYNCVVKSKVPFIIRNKHFITWYTCGPTVYDSSHIGHASCYVKLDILQKILQKHFKYNLVTVMNVTDIDDKIIRKARELKSSYLDISKKYEQEFWQDLEALGVSEPSVKLRVTENMDLIINFIQHLKKEGKAYKASDNSVYFSVDTCPSYGKLQNISIHQEDVVNKLHKKSNLDFALWKASKDDEPFWSSPWGNGRPGWHIECSALASHILGSNFDVHAGGIDLRFPHHENEEAQSCVYHNTQQWVNYWLHTGYLHKKHSEKMSKSLKNTISVRELLEMTNPEVFRMACIMSTYRSNMEFSIELLKTAEGVYQSYKNFLSSCDDFKNKHLRASVDSNILNALLDKTYKTVHDALCDDFDTPSVIKALNTLISVTNTMLHTTSEAINNQDRVGVSSVLAVKSFIIHTFGTFGLRFEEQYNRSNNFIEVMNILIDFRQNMRAIGINSKQNDILKCCDDVRDELKKCGVVIKDHGKASSWSI